jgi:hypothetical protein
VHDTPVFTEKGLVGLTVCVDALEEGKITNLYQELKLNSSNTQPVAL